MYLYTITNQANGKQYIGITNYPGKRWIQHKSGYGSKLVYQAIKKYGIENLRFDILHEGCGEDIKQLEIDLISKYDTFTPNGYNLTEGGEGTVGTVGWSHSIEARQKMSNSHKKRKKISVETRVKMSESHKGMKRSKEARIRISKSKSGAKHPRAKKILIENKEYGCIKNAAEILRINYTTLRRKLRHYQRDGNWPPGWRYLD